MNKTLKRLNVFLLLLVLVLAINQGIFFLKFIVLKIYFFISVVIFRIFC